MEEIYITRLTDIYKELLSIGFSPELAATVMGKMKKSLDSRYYTIPLTTSVQLRIDIG